MMIGLGLAVPSFRREPWKRKIQPRRIGSLPWRAKPISKRFPLEAFPWPIRKKITKVGMSGPVSRSLINTIGFQPRLLLVAKKTSPSSESILWIMNWVMFWEKAIENAHQVNPHRSCCNRPKASWDAHSMSGLLHTKLRMPKRMVTFDPNSLKTMFTCRKAKHPTRPGWPMSRPKFQSTPWSRDFDGPNCQ